MRTKSFSIRREFKGFLILNSILLCLIPLTLKLHAQVKNFALYYNGITSESVLRQFPFSNSFSIGTSFVTYPQMTFISAKFHLKYDLQEDFPIFKVEANNDDGTISLLFTDNDKSYGIYQYGNVLNNDFEGPITSYSGISFNGESAGISIKNHDSGLPFYFSPSDLGLPQTVPLVVGHNGIVVNGLAKCTLFQLLNHSGDGNILVSDAFGNGIWTDPSLFDDKKWMLNSGGDIYPYVDNIRLKNVGIGFRTSEEQILSKLHIVDGNILISKLHSGTPCSSNGSILFGDENVSPVYPYGKWGIEYMNGGLNFWKVSYPEVGPYEREDIDNYTLFLKDDHTVGIGTNNTNGFKLAVNGIAYCDKLGIGTGIGTNDLFEYKLAVKGDIICEALKVKLYSDTWPDFVLYNDYNLMPLNKLEEYITQNHHLPEIPSATEINEKGLNVGEINVVLVKKIEELTKYIIDQQKQIDDLRNKIEKH